MELIERVARAMALADDEDYMEDHARYDRRAIAAIEAIFAGSRMTDYRGGIVIANPDFPIHFWNGTRLEEIKAV